MDENTIPKNKRTDLLVFPNGLGSISITEDYGKWNELQTPNFNLQVEFKGKQGAEVAHVPPQALAQVAFRLLKELREHVPDHVLERLFEQEIGPL